MEKHNQIVLDILKELFLNSDPSVDFLDLLEKAESNELGQKIILYTDYKISESKAEEIIVKHLQGKRLTKLSQKLVRNTVLLGPSPVFYKNI